jgi:ABC-2 type transport system permease protein
MAANIVFVREKELNGMRGFSSLLRKEIQAWWGTRRWWINAILWPGMLGGLTAMMLFVVPALAEQSGDPNVAAAGGPLPFAMQMGRTVFFEMGTMVLALGVIVLSQDLIADEKQSGITEWLLSKPIQRRSYILAKLVATLVAVLLILIILPSILTYVLLFIRSGQFFPMLPFISGLGLMVLHSLFYLTLTLMLGTLYSSRAPILGIALGVLLGGNFLASLLKPLLFVTPWMLAKVASMVADSQPVPAGLLWGPLVATGLWSVIFTIVALVKFEKAEF